MNNSQTATRPGRRKAPGERRAEILRRAVEVGREDGLDAVTLRRVAADLQITPGLVSHYFSSADLLLSAAFAAAASEDLDGVMAAISELEDPSSQIAAAIGHLLGGGELDDGLLWLDAWRLARRNEELSIEVKQQIAAWTEAFARVIISGVSCGDFSVADPVDSALKMLIMIDGLAVQKSARAIDDRTLLEMANRYIEAELGMAEGSLR